MRVSITPATFVLGVLLIPSVIDAEERTVRHNMVYIPGGEFIMGTTEAEAKRLAAEYDVHPTLFLTLASPVPTQMISGFSWNTATAPMDAAPYVSNIGSHVVPAFTDFHTPPEAEATRTNL